MFPIYAPVTTARVLAGKALQETAGQACVDWAQNMLGQGGNSNGLLRLAGMLPPFNHFEIASLRDQALEELGVRELTVEDAVRTYSCELLRSAINSDGDLIDAVAIVAQLGIAHDYQTDVMDFCLLYWAYGDLQFGDTYGYYWPGATPQNIVSIMRETAANFIKQHSESSR